jgi:hypothetical protein
MQITTSAVSASVVLMNWISGRFTAQRHSTLPG